jgi:hypothetical protein
MERMAYPGIIVCALLMVAGVRAAGDGSGPNLAANASFESSAPPSSLPQQWQGNPQVYSRDSTVARSGRASLKYANTDAGRYVLCTQRIPLRGGWKVGFSAWIKTQDIAGGDAGATVCLEWSDKSGKWLGGCYAEGVKGTRDWTHIQSITRVPAEASSFTLSCYARRGMTGTAWFDDVEVVHLTDPPMRTILLSPNYRGRIDVAKPEPIRVRVRLNLTDYQIKPQELLLQATLHHGDGKVQDFPNVRPEPQQEVMDLSFLASGLEPGSHELVLRLLGPGGKELGISRHALTCPPRNASFKSTIDEHRRLVVDGRPFFPLGMYWHSINEKDLKLYADSKFNCLMPYGPPTPQQMDLAQEYGLKVIYSVKDWYAGLKSCPASIKTEADEEQQVRARIRQFRNHPALLAWYLNDELPQSWMPRLEAHERWVAEEDPDHPTWVVLFQVNEISAYINSFDIIGSDPYPIGRKPASVAAQWTKQTFQEVEQSRPMWQVPQLHNWANYAKTGADRSGGRTPTPQEVRNMAWQCICEGATGLVFYSWFDLKRNPDAPFDAQWSALKPMAAEIDKMAPILLSAEPTPAVKPLGQQPAWLHWLARSYGEKLYIVAVNDGDGDGSVSFVLPAAPRAIRALGEDRLVQPTQSVLEEPLPRLAVRIYEIELSPKP